MRPIFFDQHTTYSLFEASNRIASRIMQPACKAFFGQQTGQSVCQWKLSYANAHYCAVGPIIKLKT
jgi:hypothetical protein